ncbi:ABC transporter substrate-binding protein [Paenibacillus sp. PAMC21692]|uniref:ABC transporter substrate-binding protein n=1 Tax=Paenibacillus sp. PAMC21692 TaxID=2762320 RepID=UPI00164E97DF|nr:ABC transporter substrate-binding protein [Paenibacillus sp. PAMC21692]QNK56293.1 extracellular solute-binding protein [Paenibacillus sp. PAMC21692]
MKKGIRLSAVLAIVLTLSMVMFACSSNGNNGATKTQSSPESQPTTDTATQEENKSAEPRVYPENGLSIDEEVTLKVGFWESGYGKEWFEFAVQKFSERYPNVKFDITSSPALAQILEPKIAANDDDEMYDLFYPAFSGAETMKEIRNAGKIEPVEDLFDRELIGEPGKTLRSVLSESVIGAAPDGHTYSLPMGSYTAGLFFNENLFNEKGWNKNPKTWDEFVALLETIKQDGIIPITFPGIYPEYLTGFVFDMIPWALAAEQGTFKEYEEHYGSLSLPVYTHDLVKKEYNRMFELGKKGYFPAGVAALNHTQSQMQVLQGKAAMVASGDWIGNEMKESTPEGFSWGFMGLPVSNDPNAQIYIQSAASTNSMIVWKNKPELSKKWSKEFLLFLYDFEVLTELAKAGIYPTRLDFGDDPARIASLDTVPGAVASYAANNNVVFYEPLRRTTMSSSAVSQAVKVIAEATTGIVTGKKEPFPELEKADEYMKQAWKEQQ